MLGLFSFSQSEDTTPLSFGICCCKWKIHCQSISPFLLRCLFASSFLWFILPIMYSIFIIIYLRIGLFIYSLYYYKIHIFYRSQIVPSWFGEQQNYLFNCSFSSTFLFSLFLNLTHCVNIGDFQCILQWFVRVLPIFFFVCMMATSFYSLQFTIFLQSKDLQTHSFEKCFITSEVYFITWF